MFMPYMYCLTVINVTPMYCTLWGRAVGVTTMWSLVAPCRCDNNLWCRGVVIVTAPTPLFNVYTQTNIYIYIYIYAEFLTITHVLISYLIGSEAKWPAFRSRRHFRMYIAKWKLNVSSTHIYVSRRDWIEYYTTLWSWWSYNNRNGYVVEVAARVVTRGAEACLQRLRWWLGRSSWRRIRVIDHCVTTEKVPAKYRSLKMADASLGKCSIFVYSGGIAWTRHRLSVQRGTKKCVETFGLPTES